MTAVFGDIGMQWLDVAVGGQVVTSTNTLFIKPQQNNLGPITIQNLVFGQNTAGAASDAETTSSAAEGLTPAQERRRRTHSRVVGP